MEHARFHIRILAPANTYIESLSKSERGDILAGIGTLRGERAPSVRTKQLRGPVRELIVGNHRVTYFRLETTLYFVRGFRKKTNKTPRQEIEYAASIFRQLST